MPSSAMAARGTPSWPLIEAIGHAAIRVVCRHAPASINHLVRAQQNRWRYGKTRRRGGLAVYDHLELGRKLHREIARLLAAQDAIDVGGGPTKGVYLVGSVGEQTAVSGKGSCRVDR